VIDDETAKKLSLLRRVVHAGENGLVLGIILLAIFSFINFAYYINHKVKKVSRSSSFKRQFAFQIIFKNRGLTKFINCHQITPTIKIKDTDS
jgi:hypothetical protein